MKKFLHSRSLYIGLVVIAVIIIVSMLFGIGSSNDAQMITTTVETGAVRELVSVSGVAEAEQSAELAFPTTGIVSTVLVREGSEVTEGDVLITLDSRALTADRQDALAAISRAVAQRDELIAGPSNQEREVTDESVTSAMESLSTTRENEAQKIANAQRALLSSNLTAFSNDDNEAAAPPTISGTYNCNEEGTYEIDTFSSNTQSGYSYRLRGLETGTFVASVDQAIALGDCGLRIQFDDDSNYRSTSWIVEIPNTKSSNYTTTLNSYNLTVTQAASAIALAEQAVTLAEVTANNDNAPARIEEIARANADIAQAQARLARIDAEIADRTLRAPFTGTITEIDILPGETVTTAPVVTLLAAADFEITARIPEIDIGKLLVGQLVEMEFDARAGEILTGTIDFISLQATEIDGVAYYEALVSPTSVPTWIRSGLNADIDIIINEATEQLRVPKRFVTETDTGLFVQKLNNIGTTYATTSVDLVLEGNDGFIAITGVTEGDILVAP